MAKKVVKKQQDILVRDIDIALLRKQRNALLKIHDILDAKGMDYHIKGKTLSHTQNKEVLVGVTNILDHMLDVAEGFDDN